MYKAINFFRDTQDNRHLYNVGDTFPRKGVEVSDERIAELSGSDNKQKRPVIQFVPEPKKHTAKKAENSEEMPAEE